MMIFYAISNLSFLILLILSSLKGESRTRLLLKIITSLHFCLLAFFAFLELGLLQNEVFLLIGLGFSLVGDVALGLKYKTRKAIGFGLFFFTFTQLFYILYFGVSPRFFMFGLPLLLFGVVFAFKSKKNPDYNFKGLGIKVGIYASLLGFMVSTACSSWSFVLLSSSTLSTLGAISFFFSDFILLHLYFYKHKKTSLLIATLILYHLGQNLLALSLWIN